jgi:hypothetical protein
LGDSAVKILGEGVLRTIARFFAAIAFFPPSKCRQF